MEHLPADVLRLIALNLTTADWLALSLTCRRMFEIYRETKFTNQIYQKNKKIQITYPYLGVDGKVRFYSFDVCIFCGRQQSTAPDLLWRRDKYLVCTKNCHRCNEIKCEALLIPVQHKHRSVHYCTRCISKIRR